MGTFVYCLCSSVFARAHILRERMENIQQSSEKGEELRTNVFVLAFELWHNLSHLQITLHLKIN